MASSTVTRVGGVIIVTQVIPQDEQAAISLKDTSTSLQAPPTETDIQAPPIPTKVPPPAAPEKEDKMAAMFLRGQPVILGVFQLFLGLMCVLFGLTAAFSRLVLLHAPVCAAFIFIIAGSVTLKAAKSTTLNTVRQSAGWSVLSSVLSLGGMAYLSWLLAVLRPTRILCEGLDYYTCMSRGSLWALDRVVLGLQVLVLVLLLMEMAFSITVSVFSMKAIRLSPQMSKAGSDVSLLYPE